MKVKKSKSKGDQGRDEAEKVYFAGLSAGMRNKKLEKKLDEDREIYIAGLNSGVDIGINLGFNLRKKIRDGSYEFA